MALALVLALLPARAAPGAGPDAAYRASVAPFLARHCVRCHGEDRQSGKVRLDRLSADAKKDAGLWLRVRDQVRDGLMPPAKAPRPTDAEARAVVAWASRATGGGTGRLPREGNLIPHELLFGGPAPAGPAPPPRLWRLNPHGYLGMVGGLTRGNLRGVVQPFTLDFDRGIRDYAGLYTIDEPSTEVLLRNAERVVEVLTGGHGKGAVRELAALTGPDEPTPARLRAAVQTLYRLAIGRAAAADEEKRLLGLYARCAKGGDRAGAARTMLQAVLLKTDALFRSELGQGNGGGPGRKMLGPLEIAAAVGFALCDRREPGLLAAAQKGELTTPARVAAHVRRVLADPKVEKPGLLRFFREYFDYGNAVNVFKNNPEAFTHEPAQLVSDTDRLVLHVLAQDKEVFSTLLTTDKSFVNLRVVRNRKTRQEEAVQAVPTPRKPKRGPARQGVEHVYGVGAWSARQPMTLPAGTRRGVLMQPSWLAAYSTNFENDVVRRGRWVRERLLGGTVPDLPIGVVAQVPDEPHRTFRDRMRVTRAPECWKCHRQMDDLGLPFEQFDHFGRFRTAEEVLDPGATARNVDRKGKVLGPVYRAAPLDARGVVEGSGDAKLDGPVKDPRELVLRLAASTHARQVFVRHAFRFYLGRNETLSDARTLQQADRAYAGGGGSFKALVVSLLTSDSFLYRSTPASTGEHR
jgi:hypothetical protein